MCDDIFDEYSEAITDGNDWHRMETSLKLTGYREGAHQGQEQSLQRGFNRGFHKYAQKCFELAQLRGVVSAYIGFHLMRKDASLPEGFTEELEDILEQLSRLETDQREAQTVENIEPQLAGSTDLDLNVGQSDKVPGCNNDSLEDPPTGEMVPDSFSGKTMGRLSGGDVGNQSRMDSSIGCGKNAELPLEILCVEGGKSIEQPAEKESIGCGETVRCCGGACNCSSANKAKGERGVSCAKNCTCSGKIHARPVETMNDPDVVDMKLKIEAIFEKHKLPNVFTG